MDFLKINGGHGEGGGQIIRSAVTLSCITGRPVHLENIRRNRRIPGLQAQHLTVIRILQKIAGARVAGAELGSAELKFIPGNIKSLELVEDVRTAGSISLILQALIPVVSVSQKRLNLTIKGGTDVSWSPSTDYTRHVLREAYSKMGIEFSIQLHRRGYYPKGGGQISLQVHPSRVRPVSFSKRRTKSARLICTFSKLPAETIKSQIADIEERLTREGFAVRTEIQNQDAADPGASLLIYSADEHSVVGKNTLFDKKTQGFDVDLKEFAGDWHGVDKNLADMIVVPASLTSGKTVFQVGEITRHLETNLFVASKITGCRYGIGKTASGFEVIIEGVSNPGIKQGCKKQDGN